MPGRRSTATAGRFTSTRPRIEPGRAACTCICSDATRNNKSNTKDTTGTNDTKENRATVRCVPIELEPVHQLCPEQVLSLIHISEPTRLLSISYAVFCLK